MAKTIRKMLAPLETTHKRAFSADAFPSRPHVPVAASTSTSRGTTCNPFYVSLSRVWCNLLLLWVCWQLGFFNLRFSILIGMEGSSWLGQYSYPNLNPIAPS
ncbi:hypothetical protein AAC387_Pa05g1152 [Persea americana]